MFEGQVEIVRVNPASTRDFPPNFFAKTAL
jgi:hypothetical protein